MASPSDYKLAYLTTEENVNKFYECIVYFLEQPHLALEYGVEEIHFNLKEDHGIQHLSTWFHKEKRDGDQQKLLKSAIKKLGLAKDMKDDLKKAVKKNDPYALLILIISMCPNIHTFRFSGIASELLTPFLLENNYYHRNYLTKLRHIELLEPEETDTRNYRAENIFEILRYFHRLPSIESFHASGICANYDAPVTGILPTTSSLKEIHVEKSGISSTWGNLETLLRIPTALQDVKISRGNRKLDEDFETFTIYPKNLGKALSCHTRSLRKLDLDLDEGIPKMGEWTASDYYEKHEDFVKKYKEVGRYEVDKYAQVDRQVSSGPVSVRDLPDAQFYGSGSSIGSLHNFTNLTHLSIGVKLLLGVTSPLPFRLVNGLPPSLQSFNLRGYVHGEVTEYDEVVEEFLRVRESASPNLSILTGCELGKPKPVGEKQAVQVRQEEQEAKETSKRHFKMPKLSFGKKKGSQKEEQKEEGVEEEEEEEDEEGEEEEEGSEDEDDEDEEDDEEDDEEEEEEEEEEDEE